MLDPSLPTPFTSRELARYAQIAVEQCLDLRPGESLLVTHEPEHRPLAVALAEAAYEQGLLFASLAVDPLVRRAELEHADNGLLGRLLPWQRLATLVRTEEGAAGLFIVGDGLPGALDRCDPGRIAQRARSLVEQVPELFERIEKQRDSYLIVAYPTEGWARQVYPELAAAAAQRALAEDLLSFCRIGPADGEGSEALVAHIAALRRRADLANELGFSELRFRGPGTDLRVGLPGDAVWQSIGRPNAFGRMNFANLPSEEIFTTPAASATEGIVRCTFPLSLGGRLYEEIRSEFRGGRLVHLEARTEEQRDALLGQLDVDEGGRRLGEIALVDGASRIGRSGRIYRNTLLDENQACHMAFGLGFSSCRTQTPSEDLNRSRTHIDVMIGSAEVEVTGRRASGEWVTLIKDHEWRPV